MIRGKQSWEHPNLLVAALYTTFTLAKVDNFMSVPKYLSETGFESADAYTYIGRPEGFLEWTCLDLNVVALWVIPLQENTAVLEERPGPALNALEGGRNFAFALADLHAYSSSATTGLDHDLNSV